MQVFFKPTLHDLLDSFKLRVKSWMVQDAIKQISDFLKLEKKCCCVVRKNSALKKFIDHAKKSDDLEVATELQKIKDNCQALLTFLNDDGEEDWGNFRIVEPESREDDLNDCFIVSATGRVAVVK